MGTSYQTVLAVGGLTPLRDALREARWEAYVVPVAEQRWAVLPRETDGYADVHTLAGFLSLRSRRPAASFDVFDSDVMSASVFVAGEAVHDYVSDRSVVDVFFDDDGTEYLAGFDGTRYAVDETPPGGPGGADPEAFAPLGVGPVDRAQLGAALRGDVPLDGAPRLFAQQQHRAIVVALNLDPTPLGRAFRHVDRGDFATGLHVPA
ncbi:hypothetical protein [Micromonospora coxensis]|uniref:hypothetical protein n=1 Tax=Micromonospora coxensis TaxID=356852 RepID=UPI00343553AB